MIVFNIDELRPGDIIMTSRKSAGGAIIRSYTGANSSHAILVTDPPIAFEARPGGTFNFVLSNFYVSDRSKIKILRPNLSEDQIKEIHNKSKLYFGGQYDLPPYIKTEARRKFDFFNDDSDSEPSEEQKRIIDSFFCSMLVAKIFSDVGFKICPGIDIYEISPLEIESSVEFGNSFDITEAAIIDINDDCEAKPSYDLLGKRPNNFPQKEAKLFNHIRKKIINDNKEKIAHLMRETAHKNATKYDPSTLFNLLVSIERRKLSLVNFVNTPHIENLYQICSEIYVSAENTMKKEQLFDKNYEGIKDAFLSDIAHMEHVHSIVLSESTGAEPSSTVLWLKKQLETEIDQYINRKTDFEKWGGEHHFKDCPPLMILYKMAENYLFWQRNRYENSSKYRDTLNNKYGFQFKKVY